MLRVAAVGVPAVTGETGWDKTRTQVAAPQTLAMLPTWSTLMAERHLSAMAAPHHFHSGGFLCTPPNFSTPVMPQGARVLYKIKSKLLQKFLSRFVFHACVLESMAVWCMSDNLFVTVAHCSIDF